MKLVEDEFGNVWDWENGYPPKFVHTAIHSRAPVPEREQRDRGTTWD